MKIKRIEIGIHNKRHYAEVAILVDKIRFLELVEQLRIKWEIKKLFMPDDYEGFQIYITKKGSGAWWEFKDDIENIRLNFNRLPNFNEVIMNAVAFGTIPEGVYKPCYLEMIVDPADPDNEQKYKYAIILTPNTTFKDIKPVLNEYFNKFKIGLEQKRDPKKMAEAIAKYKFELGPQYTAPTKKVENIIRDRNWYWLKIDRKLSYSLILDKANNDGISITRDGIIKAIKAYQYRLLVEI